MPARTDYNRNGRHRADAGFRVVTRDRQTVPSPVMLKVPLRAPGERVYTVPLRYQFRWDLLANELLGDVILRWVLMRHNRISDPFSGPLAGQRIMVPGQAQLDYYLGKRDNVT